MTTFTIIMLSLILVLVALAHWPFGDRDDARRMRYELEALRAWQREFAESLAESLATAYDRSRERLQMAREQLLELKEEVVEGLEQQVRRAHEQLDELALRLEERSKAAKDTTLKAAQTIERAIGVRVRRVQARTDLLRAKVKISRAVDAAGKHDFDRADQCLSEAADLLRDARKTLGDDLAYNKSLHLMKWALRDATSAVRSHAENVRQKVERVLTDADRLVGDLESDEGQTAGKSP